jgi:hypothetical protein
LDEWCAEHVESHVHISFILAATDEPPGKHWTESKRGVIGRIDKNSAQEKLASELTEYLLPPLPRYVSLCHESDVIATRRLNGPDDFIEFTIPAEAFFPPLSSVHLQVVDAASNAPIADARVGLNPPGIFGQGTHETSADGTVHIEDVKAGRYYLTIVARGHEWVQEEVVVGSEPQTDLGVHRLGAMTTISGEVVDDRGPAAGVEVVAFPLDRFDKTRETRKRYPATSSADGRFAVPSLGRGRYLLRVQSADWAVQPLVVDTSAGDVADAIVRVSHGLDVRVAFDDSFVDSWLTIVDGDNVPVYEHALDHDRALTVRLVPGKYIWQVETDGRRVASREFVLATRSIEVRVGR